MGKKARRKCIHIISFMVKNDFRLIFFYFLIAMCSSERLQSEYSSQRNSVIAAASVLPSVHLSDTCKLHSYTICRVDSGHDYVVV